MDDLKKALAEVFAEHSGGAAIFESAERTDYGSIVTIFAVAENGKRHCLGMKTDSFTEAVREAGMFSREYAEAQKARSDG